MKPQVFSKSRLLSLMAFQSGHLGAEAQEGWRSRDTILGPVQNSVC